MKGNQSFRKLVKSHYEFYQINCESHSDFRFPRFNQISHYRNSVFILT